LPFPLHKRLVLLLAMQAAATEEEDQQHRLSVEVGERALDPRGIFQLPVGGRPGTPQERAE
jgi:hypothetical protein